MTKSLVAKIEDIGETLAALTEEVERSRAAEVTMRFDLGATLLTTLAAHTRARVAQDMRDANFRAWLRPAGVGRGRDRKWHRLARIPVVGPAIRIWQSDLWEGTHGLAGLVEIVRYAHSAKRPSQVALFDTDWYTVTAPDAAKGSISPLAHYLTSGAAQGHAPHRLFDSVHYVALYGGDLAALGLTPLEHFVHVGAGQGCNPHPLFDVAFYVGQVPELLTTRENPLAHYLRIGWQAGTDPHPLFREREVRRQLGKNSGPGLIGYLAREPGIQVRPNPLFDPLWYLNQYPDVAASGLEPLTHYVVAGAGEGRAPGPWFDVELYRSLRPEVPPGRELTDYLQGGAWEIETRERGYPSLGFVLAHPELAAAGMTPLEYLASLPDQTPSPAS